jgi:uncharacterized membrane protein
MPYTYKPEPSGAAVAAHHVHRFLMSFPVACFVLVLLSDIAYWRTSFLMWHDFSSWLLFAGLVGGLFAVIAGAVGLFFYPRVRLGWPYWLGTLVTLCLGLVNSLVHAGDGWTAIVPAGLALSALTVLVMIVTAWFTLAVPVARIEEPRYG